jgi:hypothetical protein
MTYICIVVNSKCRDEMVVDEATGLMQTSNMAIERALAAQQQ